MRKKRKTIDAAAAFVGVVLACLIVLIMHRHIESQRAEKEKQRVEQVFEETWQRCCAGQFMKDADLPKLVGIEGEVIYPEGQWWGRDPQDMPPWLSAKEHSGENVQGMGRIPEREKTLVRRWCCSGMTMWTFSDQKGDVTAAYMIYPRSSEPFWQAILRVFRLNG